MREPRRHPGLRRGHLLAAERGEAGERYLLNGIRMPVTDLLELAADVAGVTPRRGWSRARSRRSAAPPPSSPSALAASTPPVCREMVRTLLHGHRYDGTRAERELGLVYTPADETLRRTVEWARAEGLLRRD